MDHKATTNDAITSPNGQDQLILRREWYKSTHVVQLVILLIGVFVVIPLFMAELFQPQNIWVVILVSPWFCYVIYYAVARVLNTTTFYLDRQVIRSRQTPLPLRKTVTLDSTALKGFSVGEQRNVGRSLRTYYSVQAHTQDGHTVTFEKFIPDYWQAKSIVDDINTFLGKPTLLS